MITYQIHISVSWSTGLLHVQSCCGSANKMCCTWWVLVQLPGELFFGFAMSLLVELRMWVLGRCSELLPELSKVGLFPIYFSLYFRVSQSLKSLLYITIFIDIESRTSYLKENFTLRFALKVRLGNWEMVKKNIVQGGWVVSVNAKGS